MTRLCSACPRLNRYYSQWVDPGQFLLLLAGSLSLVGPISAQVEDARGIPPAQDTSAAERAAQEAAREWLQHVDEGAWEAAAPGLRNRVDQEQWRQRGTRARTALGPVRSRQFMRIQSRDSLRSSPETGAVVLLRYHSTFGAEFFVEMMLAARSDEAWRVASYEVAPVTQGQSSQPGSPE
ncbi:MAG: hypothetical protein BRD30_11650 [Bacteroidetes bacterium QH_2_63_10]|nr:MAG: hypothetical protein BRD30_11650 [Bacteroidetes bacterium QH_2_63_10]